mgnify:CR=1 FL=1
MENNEAFLINCFDVIYDESISLKKELFLIFLSGTILCMQNSRIDLNVL